MAQGACLRTRCAEQSECGVPPSNREWPRVCGDEWGWLPVLLGGVKIVREYGRSTDRTCKSEMTTCLPGRNS